MRWSLWRLIDFTAFLLTLMFSWVARLRPPHSLSNCWGCNFVVNHGVGLSFGITTFWKLPLCIGLLSMVKGCIQIWFERKLDCFMFTDHLFKSFVMWLIVTFERWQIYRIFTGGGYSWDIDEIGVDSGMFQVSEDGAKCLNF